MTESVYNYELLDFTMKYINTHPEHHNQGQWFEGELGIESGTHVADMDVCGTTGCVAGWAAIFAGWHQVRPHRACVDCSMSEADWKNEERTQNCSGNYAGEHAFVMRPDLVVNNECEITSMRDAARDELGFNDYEASVMFGASNSRDRLNIMTTRLHNGEPIV